MTPMARIKKLPGHESKIESRRVGYWPGNPCYPWDPWFIDHLIAADHWNAQLNLCEHLRFGEHLNEIPGVFCKALRYGVEHLTPPAMSALNDSGRFC
jgi:hypothetical protein